MNDMMKKFLADESGQTTTEYVLILAVVVTLIMNFRKGIAKIVLKLTKGLDDGVNPLLEDLSSGGRDY